MSCGSGASGSTRADTASRLPATSRCTVFAGRSMGLRRVRSKAPALMMSPRCMLLLRSMPLSPMRKATSWSEAEKR